MSNVRIPIAISGAVTLTALATWYVLSRPAPLAPVPPAPVEQRVAEPPPAPPPQTGRIDKLAKDSGQQTGKPAPVEDPVLILPNGTKMPSLNGVKFPVKMVWDNPEWSPIVRTEHNGDLDWYVHADGSYSTTLMMWRSDLGREDATSYTLHPRTAVPVAPLPPDGWQPPAGRAAGK